jgi:hypothetical protein
MLRRKKALCAVSHDGSPAELFPIELPTPDSERPYFLLNPQGPGSCFESALEKAGRKEKVPRLQASRMG